MDDTSTLTPTNPDTPDPGPEQQEEQQEEEKSPPPKADVHYAFAGASMASQNLYVCTGMDGCSAIVREDGLEKHTHYHQSMKDAGI